jgi:hypothetical protein
MQKEPSTGVVPVVLLIVGGGVMNHNFWAAVAIIAVGGAWFWYRIAKTT